MTTAAREHSPLQVRAAEWPQDLPTADVLFRQYFAALASDPAVPTEVREKDRTGELGALATLYGQGAAALLLACSGQEVCGCASVRLLQTRVRSAEIKRLYVTPGTRGRGVGRALIQACAGWARERGARELLLDTLPAAMPDAVRLYRSLGFVPTERYNENEGCCFGFFRLGLE